MSGRAGDRGEIKSGGAGSMAASDGGGPSASAGSTAAAHGGAATPCPHIPTDQDESFCYDFESGLRGPSSGALYDLWSTPEIATASQLHVTTQPDLAQNHVLVTVPPLISGWSCAALSHSTHNFERATVSFDIWVNDGLVNASDDLSFFRYVPVDGDDVHVTSLFFRRGEALLRSESGNTEYRLSKLPRSDGKPAHVSVDLDRHGPCSVVVRIDGEQVASAPQGACERESNAFVEYGLCLLDTRNGQLSASYDDLAFKRT